MKDVAIVVNIGFRILRVEKKNKTVSMPYFVRENVFIHNKPKDLQTERT